MEEHPVRPGDLLWYAPTQEHDLYGVVLERFENVAGLESPSFYSCGLDLPEGPGVLIYWITSKTLAHWCYDAIQRHISDGRWKIVSRSVEK